MIHVSFFNPNGSLARKRVFTNHAEAANAIREWNRGNPGHFTRTRSY